MSSTSVSDDDGMNFLYFYFLLYLDDFGVALPPGFVPDKSVVVDDDKDSDYEDYDGEGIPITKLIPTSCEAVLNHGSKPVRF